MRSSWHHHQLGQWGNDLAVIAAKLSSYPWQYIAPLLGATMGRDTQAGMSRGLGNEAGLGIQEGGEDVRGGSGERERERETHTGMHHSLSGVESLEKPREQRLYSLPAGSAGRFWISL